LNHFEMEKKNSSFEFFPLLKVKFKFKTNRELVCNEIYAIMPIQPGLL